jgi:hypothetical protein
LTKSHERTNHSSEGLKARALAKILYHQARTECEAVAVLGRDDAYYVMPKSGKVDSYWRSSIAGAIAHFESEVDRSIMPTPLKLAFDPAAVADEQFLRIWGDEISRTLWLGLRFRRIVNQYFNDHVESLAANVKKARAGGFLTRSWLAGVFSHCWDIFGTSEPTSLVALRLFPYVNGDAVLSFEIELKS